MIVINKFNINKGLLIIHITNKGLLINNLLIKDL